MRRLIPLLALLLAACAINEGDNPAAPPSGAVFVPEVTLTPSGAPQQEAAPILLDPEHGATIFITEDFVLLAWDWHRALEPGELFEVLVGRAGQALTHASYSQSLVFNASGWFSGQPPGQYEWSVRVVSTRPDGAEARPITEAASPNALRVEGSQVVLPQATATVIALLDQIIAQVPAGYEASLYAQMGRSGTSALLFGRDRQLYVLNLDGQISRLSDSDGDGFAESTTILYDDPLDRAVNLAQDPRSGTIYVAYAGHVASLHDSNNDGLLDSLTPLVTDLPLGDSIATGNSIALGPDGALYVAEADSGDIFRIVSVEDEDDDSSN